MSNDRIARIEKFLKTIPGERQTTIKDMFCEIDSHGDFRTLKGVDVIINSIINIILTFKKTYIFDPEFGCDLIKYIFQPADHITKSDIESELNMAIARYEGRGKVSFDVKFLSNRKGFNITLNVEYKKEKRSATLTLDESLLKALES